MFDPSFNTYVTNRVYHPLNIVEIADAHRDGAQLLSVDIGEEIMAFKGLACLLCSLPWIQVWRGNDYVHRVGTFTWDTALQFASANTLRQVKHLLELHKADNLKLSDWHIEHLESYINRDKISVDDMLATPVWAD